MNRNSERIPAEGPPRRTCGGVSERIKNRHYSLRSKIPRSLLRGASILSINYRDKQIANKLNPNKAGTPGRDEKGASIAG